MIKDQSAQPDNACIQRMQAQIDEMKCLLAQAVGRVLVQLKPRVVLRDNDSEGLNRLTDVCSKILHPGHDLRNAIGRQDVRDCGDNVTMRHPKPVQCNYSKIGWAVDQNVVVFLNNGLGRFPKKIHRVVRVEATRRHRSKSILHID